MKSRDPDNLTVFYGMPLIPGREAELAADAETLLDTGVCTHVACMLTLVPESAPSGYVAAALPSAPLFNPAPDRGDQGASAKTWAATMGVLGLPCNYARLLSLPYLKVLQYTPAPNEPPNGPDHLQMYKQVQAAGKIMHIELPAQNIEPLLRELDPALLMLDTWVPSPAEGERLLEKSVIS